MQKPRIIVFTTAYHPLIGGAEIAVEEVADRNRGDFDFFVVTHRTRRDTARREQYRGVEIIRLGFGTAFDRMFLFPFMAAFTGIWLARARKTDAVLWGVMVSYGSLGAFFVKLVCRRTPFVLTLQEGDSEYHLRRGKFGLVGLSWRLLLQFADEVTSISTHLARHAASMGFRGNVSVIPNGADIKKFKNQSPIQSGTKINPRLNRGQKSPVIITTSRLVHKNGVDILLRAVAEVKKHTPGIRCIIAGTGEDGASLQEIARDLGIASEVVFLGSVPHGDIPGLLHGADIFVRASRSEGMGSSFVEALAAGLPIIGTAVGGITDIITDGKTGLFAAGDDPRDLSEKILLLIRDQGLARAIAENGMAMVARRFSWESIAEQYRAVFLAAARRRLSIVIAAPMFPPDLGGVGPYALRLGEEFAARGHRVCAVSYARARRARVNHPFSVRFVSLRLPTGLRHLVYFLKLLSVVRRSDVALILDQFSAGVPATLACAIARVPFVTRMEGDFLWEHYVERTRRDATLADFWKNTPRLSPKERVIRFGVRWVLARAARAAFSSPWRKEMVEASLSALKENSVIIENIRPHPAHQNSELTPPKIVSGSRERVILWAGRMLIIKNLDRLIRAFAGMGAVGYSLHLAGEGPEASHIREMAARVGSGRIRIFPPLSHRDLLEKMQSCAAAALPSLSEVGPNFIADAVSVGTPFVMTRESGCAELFSGLGLFIDPLDEADIAEKLCMIMSDSVQAEYRDRLSAWAGARDWKTAADDWLTILYECIGHRV